MWNTTREGKFRGACIRVDAVGLHLIEDYHLEKADTLQNSKRIGKDYISLKDISPKRFKEILVEKESSAFSTLRGWEKFVP
jgi:hypothetical protein